MNVPKKQFASEIERYFIYHSIRKNKVLTGGLPEVEEEDELEEISRLMHQGVDIGIKKYASVPASGANLPKKVKTKTLED